MMRAAWEDKASVHHRSTGEPERHELSSTSYCYAATGCPAGLPGLGPPSAVKRPWRFPR
jgi:hypothetical protein